MNSFVTPGIRKDVPLQMPHEIARYSGTLLTFEYISIFTRLDKIPIKDEKWAIFHQC